MGLSRVIVRLGLIGLLLGAAGCSSRPTAAGAGQKAAALIENKGSDTLVNLALAWAEEYMEEHPDVRISVTGGGSGTGIAALINGTVDIANASREMKQEEIDAGRGERHRARSSSRSPAMPSPWWCNPSNPVQRADPAADLRHLHRQDHQLAARWAARTGPSCCFRANRTPAPMSTSWRTSSAWAQKSELLFSPDTLLMPSSEGISAEVRQNPNAIGYDGLGYVTADQKMVAVAQRCAEPVRAAVGGDGERRHLSHLARRCTCTPPAQPSGAGEGLPGLDPGRRARRWCRRWGLCRWQ